MDTGETLPLEYMRCLFCLDFALSEIPKNMLDDNLAGRTISIFDEYLSYGPEAVEEVERMMNERGFSISFLRMILIRPHWSFSVKFSAHRFPGLLMIPR